VEDGTRDTLRPDQSALAPVIEIAAHPVERHLQVGLAVQIGESHTTRRREPSGDHRQPVSHRQRVGRAAGDLECGGIEPAERLGPGQPPEHLRVRHPAGCRMGQAHRFEHQRRVEPRQMQGLGRQGSENPARSQRPHDHAEDRQARAQLLADGIVTFVRVPGEFQQARDEARGLPKRHAEKNFEREAGLDGCIALDLLAATLPRWRSLPHHLLIEPDSQRATLAQRPVVVTPVRRLVDRLRGNTHPAQLSHWIPIVNPRRHLRNTALAFSQTGFRFWANTCHPVW